jgi:hypothetical protein
MKGHFCRPNTSDVTPNKNWLNYHTSVPYTKPGLLQTHYYQNKIRQQPITITIFFSLEFPLSSPPQHQHFRQSQQKRWSRFGVSLHIFYAVFCPIVNRKNTESRPPFFIFGGFLFYLFVFSVFFNTNFYGKL